MRDKAREQAADHRKRWFAVAVILGLDGTLVMEPRPKQNSFSLRIAQHTFYTRWSIAPLLNKKRDDPARISRAFFEVR